MGPAISHVEHSPQTAARMLHGSHCAACSCTSYHEALTPQWRRRIMASMRACGWLVADAMDYIVCATLPGPYTMPSCMPCTD